MFTSSILGHLKYENFCVGRKSFLVSIYFPLESQRKTTVLVTVGVGIDLVDSGISFVLLSSGTMSVSCSMLISDRLLEDASVSQS